MAASKERIVSPGTEVWSNLEFYMDQRAEAMKAINIIVATVAGMGDVSFRDLPSFKIDADKKAIIYGPPAEPK